MRKLLAQGMSYNSFFHGFPISTKYHRTSLAQGFGFFRGMGGLYTFPIDSIFRAVKLLE
jgi:hypothetical protein